MGDETGGEREAIPQMGLPGGIPYEHPFESPRYPEIERAIYACDVRHVLSQYELGAMADQIGALYDALRERLMPDAIEEGREKIALTLRHMELPGVMTSKPERQLILALYDALAARLAEIEARVWREARQGEAPTGKIWLTREIDGFVFVVEATDIQAETARLTTELKVALADLAQQDDPDATGEGRETLACPTPKSWENVRRMLVAALPDSKDRDPPIGAFWRDMDALYGALAERLREAEARAIALQDRADWGDCAVRDIQAVRAEVARLTTELAEAKRPVPCSVCVGEPLKSGRECICGGVGTEQAEMHGLRVECFQLGDELARLAAMVERERKEGT